MDPEVRAMLSGKSDGEKYCTVAYAFACLLTGPVPYQGPEYDFFPDYEDDSDDESVKGASSSKMTKLKKLRLKPTKKDKQKKSSE